ncbi:hypothetical protein, partial [Timonella senegalensis]|uniref:hypothetical protein n=1 Tax=Timonella senegalensis TaxID=1465825 RepID=UPI0028B1011E
PSDGGTWLDSSLLVSWGYSNADGKVQSQWQVEVLRDGVLVESREGSGTASSVVVDSSLNNTAYLVRVRVRAASGLWSVWETAEVVTDYPLPVTVEPVPVFDPETGSNALTFTLPDTPETYAWAGVPHASTSTKTKDGVTLTNLFANASFEAAGGMVEVRRNLASSPRAATTFSWSAIGGTSGLTPNKPFTPVDAHCPTTCVQTVTTTTSGERALVSSLAGANLVTAGKTYTISLYWACSETASVGYRFAFLDAAGSVIGNLEYGSNQLGKSGRISITKTAPAGAVRLSIGAQISNAVVVPVGATFQATGVLIEDGAFLGDYLDGTYSPDSDLAPSWAGSADASESVLRGRLVTGAQSGGSGRVAVQSTTGVVSGGYSVRIINLNDPGSAAAGINVRNWGSADVGKTYTIAAYCTIPEGYDASQDIVAGVTNRSRGIYTYGNAQAGAQAPGDPGTHLVRAIIDVTTNDSSLRLGGGGLVAQSLMWDMLTIAEGAHPDLMPFDGDTQSTTDVETITVQRQIGDGSWVTIASDIQPDSAITDPLPVLNGPNRYRAISKTSLPSSADGPNIEHEINEQRWHYINHGPALDQVVRLGANDAETSDTNRDSETHAWAGQHLPTLYIGEARNRGLTYQGDLPPDGSPWPDVEALGWIDTEACYRTPAGRRAFVHIQSVSVARAPITGLRSASINMQEIQYTEGEVSGNNDLLQV